MSEFFCKKCNDIVLVYHGACMQCGSSISLIDGMSAKEYKADMQKEDTEEK